jgi:excisionase family DNA binding protein
MADSSLATRRYLLTVADAAAALGVSKRHIERLIEEATANRKSRWKFGRELVDLAPLGSQRRMIRINLNAVVPGLQQIEQTASTL